MESAVMQDPFAPARRAVWTGPPMAAAGAAMLYLGVTSDSLLLLAPLCALGGIVAMLGLMRFLGGVAVLLVDRRRKRILAEGVASTATVVTAEKLEQRFGYPMYAMELKVKMPDGSERTEKKRGAIPPAWEGSVGPGTELPVKVRDGDGASAVDWGGDW